MTHGKYHPAVHYDRVTEAWGLLLGDELHYGVFDTGDESLEDATAALTTRMISAADLSPGHRVLDVGCGSGAPACRLATENGVEVLGITTSRVGVEAAKARATENAVRGVFFEQRDGTSNGLDNESFDRIWVLESSHLMADRQALMSECSRVLCTGGRLVLCDVIRRREIPFLELRARQADFAVLRAAFGAARMDPLDAYVEYLETAGLIVDACVDLTSETLATFDRWRANASDHHSAVSAALGAAGLETFEASLDILEGFWRDGTLGYGLLAAAKPS